MRGTGECRPAPAAVRDDRCGPAPAPRRLARTTGRAGGGGYVSSLQFSNNAMPHYTADPEEYFGGLEFTNENMNSFPLHLCAAACRSWRSCGVGQVGRGIQLIVSMPPST